MSNVWSVLARQMFLVRLLGAVFLLAGCRGSPPVFGTTLDGVPAPGFDLVDQHGNRLSLEDLRGKAVALTFIYTNCPDICPLTAQNMREAYDRVPERQRDQVALVAITVDPDHDSPERLKQFTAAQGLDDVETWYALTGDRTALQEVWAAYGIDPGTMLLRSAQHQGDEDTDTIPPDPEQATQLLAHTDAIYVIDPQGLERAFGRSDADPDALSGLLAYLAAS